MLAEKDRPRAIDVVDDIAAQEKKHLAEAMLAWPNTPKSILPSEIIRSDSPPWQKAGK